MMRPRLSRLNTWQRHQEEVLAVLMLALTRLREYECHNKSEPSLNRSLYFCLLGANNELWKARRGGFDWPPAPEARNPPYAADDESARREKKSPDFMWGYIDHAEMDPRKQGRFFVIECKRLRAALRNDWVFNKNYVRDGVLRFVRAEHGYAKGERTAAMVGYIQGMENDAILAEVNEELIAAVLPPIAAPEHGWQGVSRLNQSLTRSFPVSPLLLLHLWVDLRARISPS
jgi:hypothetical protein